jgi:gluconolactonase
MRRLFSLKSMLIFAAVMVLGFAHLAEAGVTSGKVTKWFDGIPEGVFIEGPVFDQEGNLWFVEIGSGWIARVTKDKKYEKIIDLGYEWGPNGMKFDRNGNLIICHRQRGIIELNPKTKEIRTICPNYEGQTFNGPNDLVLDSKGWAYFTDPWTTGVHNPTGDVYRVNLKTGVIMKIMDGLAFPNGIQLSEDEKILYIGECATDRVIQAILTEDGHSAWWVSYWARMSNPGGGGPDGMCYDVKGNLYVATWDAGGVAVLDPRGTQIDFIQVPEGYGTTYAIFGGPDNKTLYILESNGNVIWQVECTNAGRPLYHETWK